MSFAIGFVCGFITCLVAIGLLAGVIAWLVYRTADVEDFGDLDQ